MGLLIEGVWKTDWYKSDDEGAFKRPETQFRAWVREDSPEGFVPEAGRYHLFVSYACPWAHRTLIARALNGLEDVISVTNVSSEMGDDGWVFGGDGDADPILNARFLREIYLHADAKYTGRVTVPVLWDKKKQTIVNNESREIMRMFNTSFRALSTTSAQLAPTEQIEAIDAMMDRIYHPYNNGVYRAGFATQQAPYEKAVREVFATLDALDELLATQRYLCGNQLTEADIAMFTTSIRFAEVYYAHFKCNIRRIEDYPNVWAYVRDIYQMPEVRQTVNLPQIKRHYYFSQTTINPTRVVPVGPNIDLDAPHDRDRFA